MANVEFKFRKGAGKEICKLPGTLSLIDNKVTDIKGKANAMATSKHGGGMPYSSIALIDNRKGMARGFVRTNGVYGKRNNLKHNTLLKCLRG